MPDTSAAPSSPLVIPNPSPPLGAQTPPTRFVLFGQEWLDLQSYVTQALQLPLNVGDFTAKYGAFPDQASVNNVVGALKDVRSLAATFGDPVVLRQKITQDPNYLFTNTPPTEIYGNIVWLATQIENAASTFHYTLSNLAPLLNPSAGTPEQRAENLKAILVGPGGLSSTADDMRSKTTALLSKLTTFDSNISAANTTLAQYTNQASGFIADANKLIGADKAQVDTLQAAANDAYKKWRDFTISAVSTSVGIMVLTGGLLWPIAVGLAVGLGVAAAKERVVYNGLLDQISQENDDIQKKNQLVVDLGGLNTSIAQVAPALSTFKSNLESIEGVWVDIGANLAYIVTNYGVDQLSSLPWVTQAMKIGDATKKWQALSDTAQQFTQNSLVNYETSTTWGEKLPV